MRDHRQIGAIERRAEPAQPLDISVGMTMTKMLAALGVTCALTLGTTSAFAGEDNVAQGHLLRLDKGARRLVIRTEHGAQLQCTVTADTRVVGSGDALKDLPANTRLTVHYSKEDVQFVATEIEVHSSPATF